MLRKEQIKRLQAIMSTTSMNKATMPKGILEYAKLPNKEFADQWEKIFVAQDVKDRLLAQAVLEFTVRGKVSRTSIPLHGIILLVGPPGTGKTTLARGLAHRVAESLVMPNFHFLEVEPHALVGGTLGSSQRKVRDLLEKTIPEYATNGPLIVLLDEVETLAIDRKRLSLEANPVDVHRATDAVLAGVDHLAATHDRLLFVATSNFSEAVDTAFLSRVDLVETIDKPDSAACEAILRDSLAAMAVQWSKVGELLKSRKFSSLVEMSAGLDGRQIRKAVIGACTFSKDTAMDPSRMEIGDLIRSLESLRKAK